MSVQQLPVKDKVCVKKGYTDESVLIAKTRCGGINNVKEAGWANRMCLVYGILGVLYLIMGGVLIAFCSRARTFDIFDDQVTSTGAPDTSVLHKWNPTLAIGIGYVLIAILYGAAVFQGVNFFARSIYDGVELYGSLMAYGVHTFVLGAAVAIFAFYRFWLSFYFLLALFTVFATVGYMLLQIGIPGNDNPRADGELIFVALVGLVMASFANAAYWLFISWRAIEKTSDIKPWVSGLIIAPVIIGTLAVWLNNLMWYIGVGSYMLSNGRHGRFDIFAIVNAIILAFVSLLFVGTTLLSQELGLF